LARYSMGDFRKLESNPLGKPLSLIQRTARLISFLVGSFGAVLLYCLLNNAARKFICGFVREMVRSQFAQFLNITSGGTVFLANAGEHLKSEFQSHTHLVHLLIVR
jgi:hypothetical protein